MQKSLKKTKVGELIPPDFKTYYKPTVSKQCNIYIRINHYSNGMEYRGEKQTEAYKVI